MHRAKYLGSLSLTWIYLGPGVDKQSQAQWIVEWNYFPIPKLSGCTVKIWEWISNFIPHFIMQLPTHTGIQINPY